MPSEKHILLINPWIYDFTAFDFWMKPIGLLYIAAVLKKYTNYNLSFIDCLDRHHPAIQQKLRATADGRGAFPKEEVPKPAVLKPVARKYSRYGLPISLFLQELKNVPTPEAVLVGCTMTYWYPGVQQVVDILRKQIGSVPVILGGVYATLMPEHAQRFSGADIVVEGHGESQLIPLMREVLGENSYPLNRLETLDDLPSPAFEFLRNKETFPLLTSRGCPFRCSFCAAPILCQKFEQRLPSAVIAEIEKQHLSYRNRHLAFYDDALLLNKKHHIIPILRGLIEKKMPLAFHTPNGLHIKEIDQEMASLLKKANFQSLFLSQESFDEKVLAGTSPKVSDRDLERALVYLEKAGFNRQEINVYLMVGLPEQDVSSIKEDILRVQSLGAKPTLAYFSPVPGTEEWRKLVEKGQIVEDADPLLHNKLTFPYIWGDFSPEDFMDIKNLLTKPKRSKLQLLA